MISRVFGGFTRQSGEIVPRRASLRMLGGAAVAAVVAPAAAGAAKGGKKDKKRCQQQRAACRARVLEFCVESTCEELLLPCCEPLARCNGEAAVDCILTAID